MKILVTGGAGFIGSHLIEKLLSEGEKIIAIDNFDNFYSRKIKERNLSGFYEHKNFSFREIDICDADSLNQLGDEFTDIQAIVHLAAKAGVRPSIQDPQSYQRVNVFGTQNVLDFAIENKISQFIFASSSSVYGTNENVPWSESDNVLKPISPYASTKVSGELLGHVYSHLYGIRFLALRFFTVYGPRQRPDLAIHKFFDLIHKSTSVNLYGDGSTRRDYTFIDDIIKGILAAIRYKGSKFEIINLGNNETVSLSDLIRKIEATCNQKAQKRYLEEQPGDVPQTWANIEKAKELLNYSPDTDIDEGLRKFYNWFNKKN